MSRLITAALVLLVWWVGRLAHSPALPESALSDAAALAALGVVVLLGHLAGHWCAAIKLPRVTGYMLTGMLAGPYVVGIITKDTATRLKLINDVALVLIALTAGSELRLQEIRRFLKPLAAIVLSQTVVIMTLSLGLMALTSHWIIPPDKFTLARLLVASAILGTLATANSPSVAVAVISEMRARGRLTDLVMAVTVAKDVLVIVLFTVFMTLARTVLGGASDQFAHSTPLYLVGLGSILTGVVGGVAMVLYLKFVGRQVELAILTLTFILVNLVRTADLELLFTAILVGFIVENYSTRGRQLLDGLERISPPIFIVFFALAGAAVDLKVLLVMGVAALSWTLMRGFGIWSGTLLGLKLAKVDTPRAGLLWMGYIPQAGVTLGMVGLVAANYPIWGEQVRVIVVAMVAINQILGPIGFRYLLVKSENAGKGE